MKYMNRTLVKFIHILCMMRTVYDNKTKVFKVSKIYELQSYEYYFLLTYY